jgi:cytochrome c biogenesis protein CcmG, thiol:disulfide interchange protein DsbE
MHRGAQMVSVVVVCALLGLLVWKVANSPKGLAGKVDKQQVVPAYPFSASRVGATGKVSLASLRGKVVVLNFWQSYCPPCTHEAPVVSAVSKQWAGKDVVFVGVDEQDLSGPATAFMKRFDITYPVISDDGPLIGHYGVTGYPETFFIDKHGRVIPLPPNKSGQVGHIVGAASADLLDLGIRTAIKQSSVNVPIAPTS